ncbi:hypothetical protein Nepgr_029997 [Nepenthes gracilis]|uniref:Uncharacterized protein n=1 Tax=Nepenthes gracilis TaxID=150966 RepID=A0AAD3Y5N4_NEPGR|nr:hypothetical protein Nepgr_029997 [Nepenthes gracilis]
MSLNQSGIMQFNIIACPATSCHGQNAFQPYQPCSSNVSNMVTNGAEDDKVGLKRSTRGLPTTVGVAGRDGTGGEFAIALVVQWLVESDD